MRDNNRSLLCLVIVIVDTKEYHSLYINASDSMISCESLKKASLSTSFYFKKLFKVEYKLTNYCIKNILIN